MKLRADKYVWAVRLAKTRSKATELINKGKVLVNDERIKASKEIKQGDVITILVHNAQLSFKVLELLERRVGAKLVENFIKDITPIEEVEKLKLYRSAQQVYRHKGTGKPTKKDRRDLDDFMENWSEL
ncbi:MAG: RNA-binding S4 domain-containing protein [Crocinitomicaceae bacterium]